jgi:hypothetical protein
MYISLNHKTERFMEENYRAFDEQEFIEYVSSLAKKIGITDLPEIHFYEETDGAVGACVSSHFLGKTKVYALAYYKKVLDGKSFSLYQIDEIIKHELAHMIANIRYNEDCGHDERFMKVVREIGGEPSEYLSLFKHSVVFHIKKLKDEKRTSYFSLLCSQCRKVHKKTNDYSGVFQLFALSGTDNPFKEFIRLGSLGCESICCNTYYSIEAEAGKLLKGLKKDDQLQALQDYLIKLLASI